MTGPRFRGVFTALVTPFRPGGALDEAAFERLVERQIAGGVHGLVPVGTTGETSTLSHEEHRRVVELCVNTAAGRVPVIAGAGSNSTAEAIELARHAKEIGADAVLAVTPYYNRPSQEGLYRHYAAMAAAVDIPIVVYNVPSRTSTDIANETLQRLSALPNVVGIKDATGDLPRASLQRLMCGPEWVMLS
ncbi:MAG TPA: 4-hydroxy-tetrahydrodipicolinate synthase, partial [Caulobacteraceae bacterium]|nr:4-hydroxy-tetrahydrodipicolinate synthase [Caulobacteraceae bacterium]